MICLVNNSMHIFLDLNSIKKFVSCRTWDVTSLTNNTLQGIKPLAAVTDPG